MATTKKDEQPGFFATLIALALYALIFWGVWSWAMPQIWPTAPQLVVHPGYWLTFAVIWMLRTIRKVILGVK